MERYQLAGLVGVHLGGLNFHVLDVRGDLVALAFRPACDHDIREHVRIHRYFLDGNRTNAACTNN